jgi:hypothetical protein
MGVVPTSSWVYCHDSSSPHYRQGPTFSLTTSLTQHTLCLYNHLTHSTHYTFTAIQPAPPFSQTLILLTPLPLPPLKQHVSSGVVVSLSAVELHSHADNSGLRDLLLGASSPSSPSPLKGQTRRPGLHSNSSSSVNVPLLRVREHPEDGPFVENLSVLHIHDTRKLQQVRQTWGW